MPIHNKQRGLIKLLLLIVVALVILGYYRVDIRNIVESDMVQRNLKYAWGLAQDWGGWAWEKAKILIEYLSTKFKK